jgi:hypothetical protein
VAVLALSDRLRPEDGEPGDYFARDSMGREIAAALHKAGLLRLEMPRAALADLAAAKNATPDPGGARYTAGSASSPTNGHAVTPMRPETPDSPESRT